MALYPLEPTGYTAGGGWRPLKKGLAGWDCYDLQAKLNYVHNGNPVALDGVFGSITKASVSSFQAQRFGLTVDGIAGSATQVALGLAVCTRAPLPNRVKGQMMKESSMLCGIYTPQYENRSQDTGPLQRNTKYHPNLEDNFDVAKSIPVLVSMIKRQHDKYVSQSTPDGLAWRAAQGYWNSPVYADRYARGLTVPPEFLSYVASVTIYA